MLLLLEEQQFVIELKSLETGIKHSDQRSTITLNQVIGYLQKQSVASTELLNVLKELEIKIQKIREKFTQNENRENTTFQNPIDDLITLVKNQDWDDQAKSFSLRELARIFGTIEEDASSENTYHNENKIAFWFWCLNTICVLFLVIIKLSIVVVLVIIYVTLIEIYSEG
jgi:hypothetical protein